MKKLTHVMALLFAISSVNLFIAPDAHAGKKSPFAQAAKAAQEARLAKLASGPAPPVAEDGLALQDEKTVDVEQLNPLTPEVRRAALRLPLRRSIVWPRRRQAGLCSDCRPLSTR